MNMKRLKKKSGEKSRGLGKQNRKGRGALEGKVPLKEVKGKKYAKKARSARNCTKKRGSQGDEPPNG